jgi:hypothetical protein
MTMLVRGRVRETTPYLLTARVRWLDGTFKSFADFARQNSGAVVSGETE